MSRCWLANAVGRVVSVCKSKFLTYVKSGMRIGLWQVLAIVAFMAVLTVGPARAAGVHSSAAEYASASMRLVRASFADLRRGRTAANTLLRSVQGDCRGVLTDAPSGEELEIVGGDVEGTAAVLVARVNVSAVDAFVATVGKLQWRSKRIGELVSGELWALRHEMRLNPPNICTAARGWRKTGFQDISQTVVRFANEFGALLTGPESGEPVRAAIAKYASGGVKARLREVDRLERRVDFVQAKEWQATTSEIRAALGLRPTDVPARGRATREVVCS